MQKYSEVLETGNTLIVTDSLGFIIFTVNQDFWNSFTSVPKL